ncbi:four-carbon acid sugar kinase family protein [Sulfitobacter sp. F26169L]|uniref:3-oxo-tetronate kinase n=1 Tax=Sulfitobacter sp. F26169L TaxID=2996015 RepID=UPI002260C0EE|nr:3-oxo-tetronate kinase [Sulfitobacter sp. F26169L]MCX7567891.1 four-carbon acid sugar kinase family protein [Sulfitobacter sp. F26169L]
MLLGCIGDDFTGSSDLANTLAKAGMRTVQYSGIPSVAAGRDVQAGVVALKSRSIAPAEAVKQSLEALEWLQAQGCEQIFFKYCSTFDSTDQGNIGPVADALADALNAHKVIVCPAFPGAGRSVYQGYLFVKDALLNESGMENHPLTPMKDASLRRLMAAQSAYSVGHVPAEVVFEGAQAIAARMEEEHSAGHRMIIVDALRDSDLEQIGAAARGLPLVTGGSGVALGLPANFGITPAKVPWQPQTGKAAILSGSCSTTTRAQIDYHIARYPSLKVDPADVIEGRQTPQEVAQWLAETDGLPLAYSSANPDEVAATQARFGSDTAAHALEEFFGKTAHIMVKLGVSRILTAGGETSGAVVEALEIDKLEIGPEIDPGVPALRASDTLVIALKSGNFGSEDYFEKAAKILGQG